MFLNPFLPVKSASMSCQSIFGKIGVTLFYSFCYLELVWSINAIIYPNDGFKCYTQDGQTEFGIMTNDASTKGENTYSAGFYVYAIYNNVGSPFGKQIWNTIAPFTLILLWNFVSYQCIQNVTALPRSGLIDVEEIDGGQNDHDCLESTNQVVMMNMLVTQVWAGLVVICCII